jgi:hypothetical protein
MDNEERLLSELLNMGGERCRSAEALEIPACTILDTLDLMSCNPPGKDPLLLRSMEFNACVPLPSIFYTFQSTPWFAKSVRVEAPASASVASTISPSGREASTSSTKASTAASHTSSASTTSHTWDVCTLWNDLESIDFQHGTSITSGKRKFTFKLRP